MRKPLAPVSDLAPARRKATIPGNKPASAGKNHVMGKLDDEQAAAARLEQLFHAHHQAIMRYAARRIHAEHVDDVVAETFLVAWRRLDRVPDDPLPWLLAVARNTIATQQRAAKRQAKLTERIAIHTATATPAQPAPASDDRDLFHALTRLRPTEREAITLIAWDGLTPAEAATVLGQSRIAFRVRLHRAKKRLRAQLEPEQQQPLPTNETAEEPEC